MKEVLKEVFSTYLLPAMFTVVSAYIAIIASKIEKKTSNNDEDKIKSEQAKKVVNMVQQVYYNLANEEKKQKAIENLTQILNEKGVPVSEIELEVLIEDAIATFKDVWNKEVNADVNNETV